MSTVNQVMKKLKSKGNPQRRELFKRHGARDRLYGVGQGHRAEAGQGVGRHARHDLQGPGRPGLHRQDRGLRPRR
jgi:hypothetical protein